MGTVEKRNKHKKRRFVSSEEKLERELKDCMHCRFFWGHNNRCANGTCCKSSKKKEQKLPTECVGCPYYQGNGYCFPCMRSFKYENESYHIEIDDVAVFPQCYAAVVDKIPTMAKKTLIVDIGSWTIDIMPVINKSPDESKCVTIPKGLITCMAYCFIFDVLQSFLFSDFSHQQSWKNNFSFDRSWNIWNHSSCYGVVPVCILR